MFNGLLIWRGYSTPGKLKEYTPGLRSPQDFNKQAITPLIGYLNHTGGREDVLVSTGRRRLNLYALNPQVVVLDRLALPERRPAAVSPESVRQALAAVATDTATELAETEPIAAAGNRAATATMGTAPGTDKVEAKTEAEVVSADTAAEDTTSTLADTYHRVSELYGSAEPAERRHAAELEQAIAGLVDTDTESARDMLVLARLSEALERPYGFDAQEVTAATLAEQSGSAFRELNRLLAEITFSDNQTEDRLYKAIFALHIGLPPSPDLPVLHNLTVPKLKASAVSYPEAYNWTRASIRSGDFSHLDNLIRLKPGGARKAFNRAAERIRRRLPARTLNKP